jgi:hypothetical protein
MYPVSDCIFPRLFPNFQSHFRPLLRDGGFFGLHKDAEQPGKRAIDAHKG